MYAALLALPEPPQLPALRVCVSGGAALPVEVLHRFEETFGCEVLEGYGLSETSPVASFNRAGGDRRPGSVGYAVSGVEVRPWTTPDDRCLSVRSGRSRSAATT